MRRRLPTTLMAGLLIGFAVFCGFVAWREAISVIRHSEDPNFNFADLSRQSVEVGFSNYSRKLLIDDCLSTISSVYGRAQPQRKRELLLTACSETARGIISETPSHGFAWFLRAFAAAELGDFQTFNHAMRMSYASSPFELWLGELRVQTAARFYVSLDDRSRANYASDILVHLMTDRGSEKISFEMFRNAAVKKHVIDVAEKLPENVKWRLVEKMQQAAHTGIGKVASP